MILKRSCPAGQTHSVRAFSFEAEVGVRKAGEIGLNELVKLKHQHFPVAAASPICLSCKRFGQLSSREDMTRRVFGYLINH